MTISIGLHSITIGMSSTIQDKTYKHQIVRMSMDDSKKAFDGVPYIGRDKGKFIRDPIYDYIPISRVESVIIDSPWMQRLREIKQMGTTNRTYMFANNTRFEHSLGVCYLAGEMMDSLDRKSLLNKIVEKKGGIDNIVSEGLMKFFPPYDQEVKKDILKQVVRVVALLHDVGHGPFSHVSENFLSVGEDNQANWNRLKKHEVCSLEMMLEHIPAGIESMLNDEGVPRNHHYVSRQDLEPLRLAKTLLEERELIKSIFIPNHGGNNSFRPLSMIINSQLDADKLDYLRRDAYATGSEFGIALDVRRIVANLDIKGDCLCINKRALSAAESLIDSRYKAYRYIHTHHTKIQMDEILRRAIFHGLEAGMFTIWDEKTSEKIRNPFGAKYFGEITYDNAIGIFRFKYGTIDDHFVIQRIRETNSTRSDKDRHIENARYYLERYEKRILHKSLWKVSDPLTIVEQEKISRNDFRESMIKYYRESAEDYLSNPDRRRISQQSLAKFEEEIKENSVLCTLREIIWRFQREDRVPEKLEEGIINWIGKKKSGLRKFTHRDVLTAQLIFDPYPVQSTGDERDKIMILHNGGKKDLSVLSPEVRGLMLHWSIEKLFHGMYLFFQESLREEMRKEDFLFKNMGELVDYLKKEFIDGS